MARSGGLAGGADSDDVDGVAFDLEAAGEVLEGWEEAEVLLFDVRDGLAVGADHVVVGVAVQFDAEGAVVHAQFFQHASFDEEMDVLVDGGERDRGDSLFDAGVDLFRAGVAGHGLHDLIENLALVGRGEPVIRAEFTEGTGFAVRGGAHQQLVNDNFCCWSRWRGAGSGSFALLWMTIRERGGTMSAGAEWGSETISTALTLVCAAGRCAGLREVSLVRWVSGRR